MNNPLVKIPRLIPVAEKVNQIRSQVAAELRSFDIIRWDGTTLWSASPTMHGSVRGERPVS